MVRKHYSWTRARMSRSRPKTKAPTSGWLLADLSRITGMSIRRLRDYVFRDLIQPIERRGTATRYDRAQLVRLMAIKRLRAESELELADIRRRMDAMGERELEAWLANGPLPPSVLEALGGSPVATKPDGASETSPSENPAFIAWHHVQLLPGLTLQVSASASPAVRAAAKRIYEEYIGAPPSALA